MGTGLCCKSTQTNDTVLDQTPKRKIYIDEVNILNTKMDQKQQEKKYQDDQNQKDSQQQRKNSANFIPPIKGLPYMSEQTHQKLIDRLIPKANDFLIKEKATLILPDNKTIQLPILQPTYGAPMIDIQKLFQESGYFTYDPGFTCTGSCASQITYIDAEKGELRYRGYDIADLAENCTYMEVCYLLIYGVLPSAKELTLFEELVVSEMIIHQKLISFYSGFNYDSHPMAIMCGVVGALSAFYHSDVNIHDAREREKIMIKLIAKMPTIAAAAYRTSIGYPILMPKKKYGYIENFLYMMFSNSMEDDSNFKINKNIIKALEVIFITHADHEQNASTSTVRITGSSFANPFVCISAGIASLWGPAHGGANEAVLRMLEHIQEDTNPEKIKKFLDECKNNRTSGTRLMGFGHRVYRNYDPRAKIMSKMCHSVLETVKQDNTLLNLAKELEQQALNDDFFVQRKLYPNVDFYTGIVYAALDIPINMFTALFAVARSVGWICQWNEQMVEGLKKIGRPRQLYVGEKFKVFVKKEDREEEKETRVLAIKKISKLTGLTQV